MFQIGAFSKIAQVSGRLLRYYDEIGLLSPKATDPETGYRYYSAQQLPRLNRILVLKELGLSLEQIARLLDQNTSVDEIQRMMILHKAQIEQTLQEEMARLQAVEARLQQLDIYGQVQEPDVVLKSIPAQQFLALREVVPVGAIRLFEHKFSTIIPAAVGHNSRVAIVVHSPVFDPEALDVEAGYLVSQDAPRSVRFANGQVLTLRTLPAIDTMATLVHIGQASELVHSYGALGAWIERHGWQISGAGRHTLVPLEQPGDEKETVVELQMPVIKADKSAHFI